jgi:cell division protein FtsB
MKWLIAILAVVFLLLQYRLWLSPDGVREVMQLRAAGERQLAQNQQLEERNRQLSAEVRDLKNGFVALEERARSDLGMVAANETFYQVIPRNAVLPVSPATDPTTVTRTAAVVGAAP